MPAFTAHLNMTLPGGGSLGIGGDDQAADIDVLNQNFQKLDDWSAASDTRFDVLEAFRSGQISRNQQFSGLAADLGSVTGMKLGDEYQETDAGKRRWRYDGSNWQPYETGLILLRPSSVTGGTVEPDGRVKFTGGLNSLTVNGVFSSRFRDYVVEFLLNFPAGSGTTLQLTTGGTPYTGATYNSQRLTAVGTTVAASATASGTGWPAAAISGIYLSGRWTFNHPSHAGPKFFASDATQATGTGYGRESGWLGSVDANLYDGFRLTIAGQTFNGGDTTYLKIYGVA